MTGQEIADKMVRGEIDPNNQSLFFSILIKGLLYTMNRDITIRNISVPHFIPNTGDETMMLEVKGYNHALEPKENTNEDYIYTICPRAAVNPKGISLQADQLTSPYSNGRFQYDDEENIYTFVAEFRRMPVKMSFDVEYVTDTFTDYLELVQQIITKLAFIKTYSITYLGQKIDCSYNIPDSFDGEHMIDFDMATTDDRRHKLQLSIEVDTNMPIYTPKTVIPADAYIKSVENNMRLYNIGDIENDGNYEEVIRIK